MVNDMTADEKCPVEIKGELHIRNESTDVPGTKIELPIGTPVTDIAGAELEVDDVGSALQFHEFCRTFAEVLMSRQSFSFTFLFCCVQYKRHELSYGLKKIFLCCISLYVDARFVIGYV